MGWSSSGTWLAALGGSALLVTSRWTSRDRAGRPPIPVLCIATTDAAAAIAAATVKSSGANNSGGGGCSTSDRRFATFAWAPTTAQESTLAALEARSAVACLFDVTFADGAVPRRAVPRATVAPPLLPAAPPR